MQKDISTQQNKVQDIQKKDINRTFELKGHIFNSRDAVILFERSRKISTALYVVSNLFKDDILKDKIRKASLELLSGMTLMGNQNHIKKTDGSNGVLRTLVFLRSCLEIAQSTAQLSIMNAEILFEQIENFSSAFTKDQEKPSFGDNSVLGPGNVIMKDFFNMDVLQDKRTSRLEFGRQQQTETSTQQSQQTALRENQTSPRKQDNVFKREPTKIIMETSSKSDGLKTKRHKDIVAFLQGNPNVPINDIVSFVGDVSSKTIQRDLNDLIDRGIVIKEGSRRWSTYKLS